MGKPMIQHVWERSKQARVLDEVIIACDQEEVADVARGFGAKVTMTSKSHTCGTDRIAEVINPLDVKVVINIQADEPLIHPTMIDSVARALLEDQSISMATIMRKIEDINLINDPNVVKVVTDKSEKNINKAIDKYKEIYIGVQESGHLCLAMLAQIRTLYSRLTDRQSFDPDLLDELFPTHPLSSASGS
jgi:spore coat polysaccharide biosynthesis protein SpsF (cytidylyltransferase family)